MERQIHLRADEREIERREQCDGEVADQAVGGDGA